MPQDLGLEFSVVPGGARYVVTPGKYWVKGEGVNECIAFKWLDFHNQHDEKCCNFGCD